MAYNQNIPAANDLLSISQQDIQDNFAAIKTLVDVDHVDFDDPDEGKHKKVTFPEQAVAPVFAVGEIGLFNKLPAAPFPITSVNELFITNSSGTTVPMTASSKTTQGWAYWPCGSLVKWGTSTSNGSTAFTYPTGVTIPDFTAVYNVQITPAPASAADLTATLVASTSTITGFTVYGSARTTTATGSCPYFYFAIGK